MEWPAIGDFDGDGRDDLVFRAGRRIELLAGGLPDRREIGPFACPGHDYYAATPVRAGDYDRDGGAEALIDCWADYDFEPGPHRWWVWDADAPPAGFDASGFVS
ncbi:FG-GAP-like repeat-containing protein [Planobispora siamensis]|uniref:FG-GAP-like repeat-containing protein n=1 Tax=Planobispora siamensis TaxID=936338 RepID=UPI0035A255E8